MTEPQNPKDAEDDWAEITDEELLKRISQLVSQVAPNPTWEMEDKARQGLELIRKLAGLQPGSPGEFPDAMADRLNIEPAAKFAIQSLPLETSGGPQAGSMLGNRYRMIEKIGEGGMGTVWAGEQQQPVQRPVAIKLVKPGMGSEQVLRRFELERQSLAAMEHPNIARILDAGLSDWQSPYFVMELVRGSSLLQFCDEQALGIRERLELFIQIIQGVQHAHQKGIIHRDLKPTNILVTVVDGCPVPKIIDFGLAKALEKPQSAESLATSIGAIVGTLEYMSPEQAGFNGQDIDTRADVYSLGVILYELLVGLRPFASESLDKAAFDEKLRIIREEDPVRPSVRLLSSGSSTDCAAMRKTEPGLLTDLLRNELDWVVMKSLEKDRSRRYSTASDFAADLHRYLANEPVLAHPPSRSYRLRKFVRRNRVSVLTSLLILFSLVLGLAGTLWQAHAARQESRRADLRAREAELAGREQSRLATLEMAQRQEAQRLRKLAERAAESELQRAKELQEVAAFQANMLRNMRLTEAGKNLAESLERRLRESLTAQSVIDAEKEARLAGFAAELETLNIADTVIDLIDATILHPAVKELDESAVERLAVSATLRSGLSNVYAGLGRYTVAIELLEKALADRTKILGENHSETVNAMGDLGLLYQESGQLAKAEPLIRNALNRSIELLGKDHVDSITSKNNLGLLLRAMGRLPEAGELFREVAEQGRIVLGTEDSRTVSFHANLALTLTELRKYEEAEPLARQVLELRRRLMGEDHPDTLLAINNLGMLLGEIGKFEECEALTREGLEKTRQLLGEQHPQTVTVLANMGSLLYRLKRPEEAEPFLRESHEKSAQVLGPAHGRTLEIANGLANVLTALENFEQAELLRRDIFQLSKTSLGPDHLLTLNLMNNLSSLLEKKSNFTEAQVIREDLVEKYRRLRGPDDGQTLSATINLATNLGRQVKHIEAETYFREVVAISSRTKGVDHPNTAFARMLLSENLRKQNRFTDAEVELIESEKCLTSHPDSSQDRIRQCTSALIALYQEWEASDPSKGHLEKSQAWQEKLKKLSDPESDS